MRLRGAALAVLLTAVDGGRAWLSEARSSSSSKADHAAGLVQRLLDADTAKVPGIVEEMAGYRHWTDPLLRDA